MSTSKDLIVNADDLGWSSGVNRGIVEAHERGVLTSATLLTNFPGFDEAVSLAREHPGLGIGLHLNIVHGPPLSDAKEVPSLLNRDGQFPGPKTVLGRLMTGCISLQHIEIELRAQLQRFREHVGEPTHLDSHKHMHMFGRFLTAAVSLCGELAVPRMRLLKVPEGGDASTRAARGLKYYLLRWAAKRAEISFKAAGIVTTDGVTGLPLGQTPSPRVYCRLLEQVPVGATELMCHPGYASDDQHDVVPNVAVTDMREAELRALVDESVKACVREQRLRLIHFGNLKGV